MWTKLLDLLFPPRCAGCDGNGGWFCAHCQSQCQPIAAAENAQQHAQLGLASLDSSAGVFRFGGPLRPAIHALKYKRRHALARPLGEFTAQCYAAHRPPAQAIVAVPLFADRLRERGFNQAALLGGVVARQWNMPLLDGSLQRTRPTDHQANLGRDARQRNVQDAFVWHGPPPPARVVIFDDVLTTGATLAACAAALKAAGAQEVYGLALAAAGRGASR